LEKFTPSSDVKSLSAREIGELYCWAQLLAFGGLEPRRRNGFGFRVWKAIPLNPDLDRRNTEEDFGDESF
jgi:hypothetical protein